jgi:gliding motility-associated-like protein
VPVEIDMKGIYQNLDSTCINTKNWLWDFGDGQFSTHQDTSHVYTQAGTYTISLQFNDSEKAYQTITLLPIDSCSKRLFVPNTFTPNGDGSNEKVYLRGVNIRKADFRIYNRWGEEMFRTNDISIGWDGTYKGQKLSPQVVVYVANVTYWDESTETKEGNISLVE